MSNDEENAQDELFNLISLTKKDCDKELLFLLEKLQDKCFSLNFGSMSKLDYETLLFHVFYNKMKDGKQSLNDYNLSKKLGITQSKVRGLKERMELQYPSDIKWELRFSELLTSEKYVHYDKTSSKFSILIDDVNLMKDVRNFLETNGYFDDYHLK